MKPTAHPSPPSSALSRYLDALLGLLVALVAFAVYWGTLSHTVASEDTGELATTLYTLGIVHPTGYPLFTLLGWLFAHLPIEGRVIWKLSLFGAVLTATSAFIFFRLFLFLLSKKAASLFGMKTRASAPISERIAAATAALVFAFSRTFWTEAVSLEVYALHLVSLALVIGCFLRALADFAASTDQNPAGNRRWMVFAFALGLSFSNHMMTVLLAPAFLVLYFQVHGFGRVGWLRMLSGVPLFVLGLSLYLYLPLRSAQAPVMNWGEPTTWHAFWYHLSAGQYHGQMFSSLEIALRKLAQFTTDFPREFGYAPLLLAAIGMWALYRSGRRLLVFLVLLFFGCLFYSLNYAFDDPNFYLNAYLAVAIACAFGVRAVLQRVPERGRMFAGIACLAVALFPLGLNYRALDKSKDFAVEEYALNVLHSMDSGAVFFTNEYQRMAAPAFYLQIVENVRPELERYVGGHPDSLAYNARVKDLFLSILVNSGKDHPLYASAEINLDVAPGYRRIPSGMVFRLARAEDSMRIAPREPVFHPLPPPEDNPEATDILNEYAESYANQGAYLAGMGDTATGIRYLQKALEIVPGFTEVELLLREYSPGPTLLRAP